MPTGQPIATVVTLTGAAFARDAEGSLRRLRVGETVRQGEEIVTESGARVEIEFLSGGTLAIGESRTIAISPELAPEEAPDATESAVDSASVEQLLQSLGDSGDLLDKLPATSAGFDGGVPGDGHDFVRVLRIVESVEPTPSPTPAPTPEPTPVPTPAPTPA
ncbi:MAG TPA: retention module-containing protein, partial [Pseudomonadales bacterium]|nr:retention module-containing protein [Pseudomonadales bacterium]